MKKDMIKIVETKISNEAIPTVNARELHSFLGVGKDFSSWIKGRIEQYEFIENIDYILLTQIGEQVHGGHNKIDYIISIDMAKELSMVEKTSKGREARKYFIECERRLYNASADMIHFEKEVIAIKYAAEILNMSEVSKLGMIQRLFESKGFDKSSLPAYVEKKRLSFSATKLLEDRGKPVSTVAFNKLLILEGFLEERERKSIGSTVKKFKMLTEKGLQFGENLVSPKNEKEVQPYYFEDSFDELLRIIDGTGEEE